MPVEKPQGVQWFGKTKRAYDLQHSTDKDEQEIYEYCRYQHCGLDLLAYYGTPVFAGVSGKVINIASIEENNPADFEGPWKVQIQVGPYVITYGHTNGIPLVEEGQWVSPNTIVAGIGNMDGYEGSGEIDHIHFETRGPGLWAGPSLNPTDYMLSTLVQDLIKVVENQSIEIEMGQFFDEVTGETFPYTTDETLNPHRLTRVAKK